MLPPYPRVLLLSTCLAQLATSAQLTAYERTIPATAFSIEPQIRTAQLQQGDGSALLAFNAEIGALGDADMLLRKLDADGNILHSLQLGDADGQGYHDVGMEVLQQGDSYYICGYTRSMDDGNPPTFTAFLLKTDTALNFQWQRNYILPAPLELYANAMTMSANGDLLLAGQAYDGSDFHTLLMKVSATDGTLLWAKQYAVEFSERIYCVRELAGGDILLSGNVVLTFELVLPLAMKVNATGDFRWGKYYNYPPVSITEQSNFLFAHARSVHDILLCGHTDVMGMGGQDLYLVNIDSSGTVNWARTYGTPAFDLPTGYLFDEAANELVGLGSSSWFTASQSPTALTARIAPDGLLIGAELHGDTTGLVQNSVLTSTQRVAADKRMLAGWRGFPADIYCTGVDNDLANTCNTAPAALSTLFQTSTTGAFNVIVTVLSPTETDEAFVVGSYDAETVLCEVSTGLSESVVPSVGIALSPNPTTAEMVLTCAEVLRASDAVELTDLHGRTLRTLRGNGAMRMVIPRGDLAAGIYAVRVVRDGKALGTARVVVE